MTGDKCLFLKGMRGGGLYLSINSWPQKAKKEANPFNGFSPIKHHIVK